MMAIHDLSMTLDLLWVQMNFMTPEIDILKCLLEEGIAKGPAMLQPLCSFVCRLPEQVLRPLEGSLSCLLSACTPSSQHIKSQIIQHCKKFGINLRPLFNDSALLIEEQTEHYQCNSSVFLKEKNSSINNDSNTTSNSNSTISDDLSNNRFINCNHRELLSLAPPSQFVVFHHEMNTSESSGLVEHVVGDRECFQDLRCDDVPTVCEQSELPMPPTPKSLPSSVKSESVNNHLVIKPNAQEECAIAQKIQQQPLMIDYNHQRASKESPCNLRRQDKLFTIMRNKNSSHDLASSLMSPDSTNISPNISHTKTDNKEKSPANSRVMGKLAKPSGSCGFRSVQMLHTDSQKAYSKSSCKNLDSINEMVSKIHAQCRPLKNSSIPQKSEEMPRFRTVKRDNFSFPKITFNQDLRECEAPNLEGLGMNHFPPCDDDSTTSSGVENNHDAAAPLKYPRVAENVMKMFSPTSIAGGNLQVCSQQDQRSLSHQQPTTSRQIHQSERDSSSGRFSRWSGRPFTMPQRHW
ncbi:hypothetical protein E2C01_013801 [Portunus trituberculatus]|uniref:Uncharacterized protein n=1 Tax=Portunus trituberculatus TaxID=210409 RepID=A0A5B7DHM3_PORTR|nr:hypothetical protein [Portunus trituberculatus]